MAEAERLNGIADLHIHTHFSDGTDSPIGVLSSARRAGLDVIAITDHDAIEGALEAAAVAESLGPTPQVVVGEEVSSRDGHILALFIRELVPADLSAEETVAAIHAQGGLAVAAHPYWRVGREGRTGRVYAVGELIAEVAFDAIEVINGGFTPSMVAANARAGRRAQELGRTVVGGSDAHVRHAVGWAHTRFAGRSARALRQSIVDGQTSARRSRLGLAGVRSYAFWSLGRLRMEPVTS